MDGVLNINKPSGMTSHDVVQKVRRLLKEKRVGHTGTLDPLATGVLVLCVGKATRIAQYLEAGEKEYQAVMRLGVTTDTLDAEGKVLETRTYVPPDKSQVQNALKEFAGEIMQRPPAYSAVKVGGVPSYKLARLGKAEPLKPRSITIHCIDLTAYNDPFIHLAVRCSKGVYIRTLCADLGEALGTGAHLTGLTRTRSGRFRIDDTVTLDQLAVMSAEGVVQQVLVSIDKALEDFPALTLDEVESARMAHGSRIVRPEGALKMEGSLVRIHDRAGSLVALARSGKDELRPELVFS